MQESKFLKFLGFMWNPLSWVMEAAAIMAIAMANGGVSASSLFASSFFLPTKMKLNSRSLSVISLVVETK